MAQNNSKSFSHTPQARDDVFASTATGITETSTGSFILDVMDNDAGGNAKSLHSLDNGISEGENAPVDLLIQDLAGVANNSKLGALISITADGKVAYAMTPALRAQLASLKAGQFAIDTFTYAIQMGNGTLSWATATVQIAGLNTAPVVTTAPGALAGTALPGAHTVNGQLSIVDADGSAAPVWTVQKGPAEAYGRF